MAGGSRVDIERSVYSVGLTPRSIPAYRVAVIAMAVPWGRGRNSTVCNMVAACSRRAESRSAAFRTGTPVAISAGREGSRTCLDTVPGRNWDAGRAGGGHDAN